MSNFIDTIASKYNINTNSLSYRYMAMKTRAVDRDSKARRSFGNLYAIYVLCRDFDKGNLSGSRPTILKKQMNLMPFGAKLQNHALDNRLNGEVLKQFIQKTDVLNNSHLPVIAEENNKIKVVKISIYFLQQGNNDEANSARFILEVIDQYIQVITDNQNAYLNEIANANSPLEISSVIQKAFVYESDARLFEIVSHALLYINYKKSVFTIIGPDGKELKEDLVLYKTGRTNANDGGIDFVLRPLGRFFQVTETLDFKKYFLDFDKMNRFPITFVIKTDLSPRATFDKISKDAIKDLGKANASRYLDLFEEIITNNKLKEILSNIEKSDADIFELKEVVIDSYKLEFGMLD
jgi:hypothetical protein